MADQVYNLELTSIKVTYSKKNILLQYTIINSIEKHNWQSLLAGQPIMVNPRSRLIEYFKMKY